MWEYLLQNENAIDLILDYENIICPGGFENFSYKFWQNLSMNDNAIKILQKYPHKISWETISYNQNPDILEIICSNPNKIDWNTIWENENIFEKADSNANYGLVPIVSNGTTILVPMFQSYKQAVVPVQVPIKLEPEPELELELELPQYSNVVEKSVNIVEKVKFCQECGYKSPKYEAKFCLDCGTKY